MHSDELEKLLSDFSKYITTNTSFHSGDLIEHSLWTAFYVNDLFDDSKTDNPLHSIWNEDIVDECISEGVDIDVRKVLILSALLHDIGKGNDHITTYYDKPQHPSDGAEIIARGTYNTVDGEVIDINKIFDDFLLTEQESMFIITLIEGHWLIGEAMKEPDPVKYFVEEFKDILEKYSSEENPYELKLGIMMQLVICVADVLAATEYYDSNQTVEDFPQIKFKQASHDSGRFMYQELNYDDIVDNFVPAVFDYLLNDTKANANDEIEEFENKLINQGMDNDDIKQLTKELLIKGKYNYIDLMIRFLHIQKNIVFNVLISENKVKEYVSHLMKLKNKSNQSKRIESLINSYRPEIIEELVNQGYIFKPKHLGLVRKEYKKEQDPGEKRRIEDVFNIILSSYDSSHYYISDKHKRFCENLRAPLLDIPQALEETTLKVTIPIIRILPTKFHPMLFDNPVDPSKDIINFEVITDNYKGGFGEAVKDKVYEFDTDWAYKCMSYMSSLSLRDKFTVYGYTYNGDQMAHKFLMGNMLAFNEYLEEHIYQENNYNEVFFPLFYQCMDILNVSNVSEGIYNKFVSDMPKYTYSFYTDAVKLYIDDLNRIIQNSPPMTKSSVLYRGSKDKYYYKDTSQKEYVNNTFMSTSYNIKVAFELFAGNDCCVKKIIATPGTKALFIESLTSNPDEFEVLLGLNNTFKIVEDEVKHFTSYNRENFNSICESDDNVMDVTVMEIVNNP